MFKLWCERGIRPNFQVKVLNFTAQRVARKDFRNVTTFSTRRVL